MGAVLVHVVNDMRARKHVAVGNDHPRPAVMVLPGLADGHLANPSKRYVERVRDLPLLRQIAELLERLFGELFTGFL